MFLLFIFLIFNFYLNFAMQQAQPSFVDQLYLESVRESCCQFTDQIYRPDLYNPRGFILQSVDKSFYQIAMLLKECISLMGIQKLTILEDVFFKYAALKDLKKQSIDQILVDIEKSGELEVSLWNIIFRKFPIAVTSEFEFLVNEIYLGDELVNFVKKNCLEYTQGQDLLALFVKSKNLYKSPIFRSTFWACAFVFVFANNEYLCSLCGQQ